MPARKGGHEVFCGNWENGVDKRCDERYNLSCVCGRSSSGRARPCQGRGSEFEPRRPLQKETPSVRMVFSFWNVAGRVEHAASTSAHQRTDCCRISRREACPQAAAVYRRCLRLPRGGVRAPRPTHERGEPFRRGRRPRRPVSAAVPRWERIPTSLRAAKQVPLGYSSE